MLIYLTLAEWNQAMGSALPEEKSRLRKERREGLIEITDLSNKYAATRERLMNRQRWKRGEIGPG